MPRPSPKIRHSVMQPSLADLQHWMRWIITEPRGIRAALTSSWPHDPALAERYKEPERQLDVIEEAAPLSRHDRLDVYANAYFYRLLDSLTTDFKTVHRIVGEEKFHDLVAHFLMHYPSHSPNIGDLGEAFPEFIKGYPLSEQFPFLHDLAALERAIMECLYTHHLPALDASSIQTKSEDEWAKARFVLDPSLRLMNVQWPVDSLWKRREHLEPLLLPGARDLAPRYLLLYRDDNWVRVSVVDVQPWTALHMLRSGMPLEAVCDALSKQGSPHSEALPVMEWFSSWVAAGIVRQIIWDEQKETSTL
jgi:hypothetical protein